MRYLILGCGWIGEALAKQLKALGHEVYATTTQEEKCHRLRGAGIFAIQADFNQDIALDQFPPEVDFVLNSVPASARYEASVVDTRLLNLALLLHTLAYKKHIFLSSTGVYPDRDGLFVEDSPIAAATNLARAESKMLSLPDTHVYRLGGLFGQSRIFAKYFQDKVCTTGNQLANFVHQDDVIQLLLRGFTHALKNQIYNVVAPEHPTKQAVILASAKKYGFQEPAAFQPADSFQKMVSGEALMKELNYSFIYRSPLDF